MGIINEKQIEVRYAETDQMAVVYHANYLVWMEIGRTSLIQELGFTYAGLEREGYLSPVVDLNIQYKQACTYGETVTVRTWLREHGRVRTIYAYEIVKENGEVAATAESTHVLVKKGNFRPVSLSKVDPAWHEAYEKNVIPKEEK